MIKFFRHIRQRLLKERQFSKYVFYALGEIILVVIGILIALQINNWNENRKKIATQVELIDALIFDLNEKMEENVNDREAGIMFLSRAENALTAAKAEVEVDSSEIRQILGHLGVETWYFTTNTPAYNSILNSDLWQQLPDSIALPVQYIYDHKFSLVSLGFVKLTDLNSDCRLHFLAPTGLMDKQKDISELNDIILKNQAQFISRLILFVSGVTRQIQFFKDASDAIDKVLPKLKEYRDMLYKEIQ